LNEFYVTLQFIHDYGKLLKYWEDKVGVSTKVVIQGGVINW